MHETAPIVNSDRARTVVLPDGKALLLDLFARESLPLASGQHSEGETMLASRLLAALLTAILWVAVGCSSIGRGSSARPHFPFRLTHHAP
jgi:hypothetical protein